MFDIGDVVIAKAHWQNKQELKCKILRSWSSTNDLFWDVETSDGVSHCVRKEDIINVEKSS